MECYEVDFAGEEDRKNIKGRDHVTLESTTLELRDIPYVCLVVRNQPKSYYSLRNRVIGDSECAVSDLDARGIDVVRMSSHNEEPLQICYLNEARHRNQKLSN